ncbi:serine protease SSP1-like isoform X1 [Cydia strobilella]|uniref:serine protease SSP1-like isoform X1 n=1 Tax=Cydia strobilella TaxID=1100964 RepID=UPI003004D9D3
MAKAVVFLFLLDSLPDFNNVINTTLHTFDPGLLGVPCDSTITAPILQVIGKKLNLTEDSVEKLQHIDLPTRYQSHKFQELAPESLNNVGFQDNSIQESNEFSIEKRPNFIEHIYTENVTENKDALESEAALKNMVLNASKAEFSTEKNHDFIKHNYFSNASQKVVESIILKSNATKEYPESAPFLAAIFETVGNVTAQTCGGVVVSSHWVLTAASCVNVLGPFYSNSSNETTDNSYSIVASAKDPLKDGTVHQVSKIYLHPTSNHPKLSWLSMVDTANAPSLALLRVEPGVKGGVIGMMENRTWNGDGRIYSWSLRQNQIGFEMTAIASPAKQLGPEMCKKIYGIAENNTTMCFTVNETTTNHTRMSSGCPVVLLQEGRMALLAVALTDGMQPLLATPLAAHRDWLLKLTRENAGKDDNKLKK